MRASLRTLALLVPLVASAGTLVAQHHGLRPVERGTRDDRGIWVLVGVAQGREQYRFDADPDWSSYFEANSFMLSAGGTVSPGFTVGIEWNVWSDYEADSDQKLHALSLIGNWYVAGTPLFLKGGVGLGIDRIEDATGIFRDTGTSLTVGAGIDIPIARRVAIQPRIDHYIQRYDDAGQANDFRERLTQIGVAVRLR